MLKRAAQQRFVAWLALAAMALIVLMPAVSRSMPANMDMGMGAMSGMSADCGMNHSAGDHHQAPAMPGNPDDPNARCAYCALLAHSPMAGFVAVLLWLPADVRTAAPSVYVARSTPIAPILSAHPRGPPLRLNG